MAAKSKKSTGSSNMSDIGDMGNQAQDNIMPPGTTGKYLVLLREDSDASAAKTLSNVAGLRVTDSRELGDDAGTFSAKSGTDGIIFRELGVVVVDAPPDQTKSLGIAAEGANDILAVEPEQVMYALDSLPSADYFRGYRDGVSQLVESVVGAGAAPSSDEDAGAAANPFNEINLTWGLQITRADVSTFTGKGIRVAVLDTGFDLGHPDFAGRNVTTRSFVSGQAVQDGHGHGTHCIGTSCGTRTPRTLPRYGIASEANIFVGKVLSNQGSGTDSSILAGINWAVGNNCVVISMSLGAPVAKGETFSPIYEAVARRSLAKGTLIVAAAGNESQRPFLIKPVGRPANCPSILAVAAIDPKRAVASFSCGAINGSGGEVNIAGPGVAVRSSWPRPTLYNTISGTSMATPHVAGIAALYAQANPNSRGMALWNLLVNNARAITLPVRDVGRGLVTAP